MDLVLEMSLEIEGFDDLVNEEEIREYVEKVLEKEYDSKAPVYVSLLFTGMMRYK